MNKKLYAKILIPVIALGILLAPISPVFKVENGTVALKAGVNTARAEIGKKLDFSFKKEYTLIVNLTAFLAQARTAVFF